MNNLIAPDRLTKAFANALTWHEFLDRMKVNRATIEANFEAHRLTQNDLAGFYQPLAPLRVLALVHDWCGDVVASLPILARFEEAGLIKLFILEKNPDNTDLGLLYPHSSGEVHIPIYIIFDESNCELGHFIERSPTMDQHLAHSIAKFWAHRPEHAESGKGFGELSEATRTELLAWITAERQTQRHQERQEFIAWVAGFQKLAAGLGASA